MTVSIIIAVKTWQKNLEECVAKCRQLDYPDFEIIVLPDFDVLPACAIDGIKIIPTGALNPAEKRDKALEYARGEILAFLDDDAYPQRDWLSKALENFLDPEVAAVGGPAVTPPQDSLMQKASGATYASFLVSGRYIYRYVAAERQEVDDYPSCNFLVRKSVMLELGGFSTKFWPGEDTKLCLEITKRLGKKIIYDPRALVYHHRRRLFIGHLKQIANYALHRGYFVKKYPQTSLKPAYFIPSIFLVSLICGAFFSLFLPWLRTLYFTGLCFYLAAVLFFSLRSGLRVFVLVFLGTALTHLTYGGFFIRGLISRKLKEEL
jgi:cellulose synthase/poly-beta-1,6-N-acetylglucosamine synthase-like glycosyltransferase